MTAHDLYARVTDSIVTALERGGLPPWRRPWTGGNPSLPLRHAGQPYRGVNTLILWIESDARGHASPYWMTFLQAKEYGGGVRKGEQSTAILWCEPIRKRETAEDGTEAESRSWISKTYRVFNADQCDGLPDRFTARPAATLDPAGRIAHAEAFVANTGADIRHGPGGAFYRPAEDFINLPPFEAFRDPESFYGVALHELGHWSGHGSRLARDLKGPGDRQAYSREELVAELTGCFVAAALGIAPARLDDHAAYIGSWIEAMKADPRYLFTVASKAQAAADFLHGLQPAATG